MHDFTRSDAMATPSVWPAAYAADSGAPGVAALQAAPAELRSRSDALRQRVRAAEQQLQQRAAAILASFEEAERQGLLLGSGDVADAEAVEILERRLAELRLQENEQRQEAETEQLRTELRLDELANACAEAERLETVAELAAAAGPPAALRAQLAAEEMELENAQAMLAALRSSQSLDPEEARFYEWSQMLAEDRPDDRALLVASAAKEGWARELHTLIAPEAFGALYDAIGANNVPGFGGSASSSASAGRSGGVGRLDAELLELTARERLCRTTSADCLQRLSEKGAWRLVYSEVLDAYRSIEELQQRNDELAAELAGLRRWRLGMANIDAAESSTLLLGGGMQPALTAPLSAALPRRPSSAPTSRGPRFRSPAALLAGARNSSPAGSLARRPVPAMPPSVVNNAADWRISSQQPPRQQDGLTTLLGSGMSGQQQRLRPSPPSSMEFEASPWGLDVSSVPAPLQQQSRARRPMSAGELAKRVAEQFAEPLSVSLGKAASGNGGSVAGTSYGQAPGFVSTARSLTSEGERARPRPDWITFTASATAGGLMGGEASA
eukprot:TRINITY_DN101273_c0_g1_i1.p1 TRINITY_DN101273_c0_g1~~TRINITY_DN101273_c0_g1_i1.p1  ORF type:complete len:557 (-),score=139.63 TRINITY_DN101273_c0_g1_i1:42-1712(-)